MLREQVINFLQAAVLFLLLTNAVSALVAMYAMRVANGLARATEVKGALELKLDALRRRAA